jgi:hypothetical protein
MKQPLAYLLPLFLAGLVSAGHAQRNPDITQVGRDIRVQPDQKAGDLTCINCSIHVRGQVAGDVTAVHGQVVVDDNAQVAGDVTAVAGDIRLNNGASVSGDLTAVAGSVIRQPGAAVAGDVTALPGLIWIFLMVGAPLVVLGMIIAFIVWLVQRGRTPAASAPVRA